MGLGVQGLDIEGADPGKGWGRQMSQGWLRYTPDVSEGSGKRKGLTGEPGVFVFGYLIKGIGGWG